MSLLAEPISSAVVHVSTATFTDDGAAPADAADTHELTTTELHAALSELGHNRNGELVLTRCLLNARHLSRLPGLERYSNLQQLVLDDNALTELTAVRHMPQLVYLSARRNRLTSDVLNCLAGAAGCLERLHLDHNCLTSLHGLESLPYLTDLSCSENEIDAVPARCLSAAQRLMRLRLDHNRIALIDGHAFQAARHLRVLELEHNALTSVDFLHSVAAQVERVVLADNEIVHLDRGIQHLAGLTVLDVRRNALQSLEELRVLRALSALRVLNFEGNAQLQHLPQVAAVPPASGEFVAAAGEAMPQLPSVGRTEYHAEVVMSDAEGGEDDDDYRASEMAASSYVEEQSRTVNPASVSGTDGEDGSERFDDREGSRSRNSPRMGTQKGVGAGCSASHNPYASTATTAAAAVPAAPTTAAYVVLAAPETHDFVRTVGSAARDAELNVKVDKGKEIAALPEDEQVYLWTLSVLPHLLELNGRSILPADVARANFLFSNLAHS